ncbi:MULTISPECIES: CNNM domain-containing protein [Thalassotalea]|uniref:CNNM domain-containing protein n=1 Tax=Thalassotalea TaxID=1518149 RepID=UPI0009433A8F|nr:MULTISPECIES: CNNM domain-containing protein [Thalassotalea]OKY27329.1 transporter [Thalassotalea sp. PP2-459]
MTLLLTYLAIAIGVSFLCSILEAVLLSVTPSFVENIQKDKPLGGKVLSHVKDNIDKSISSILILNTFAHTMGAAGVGAQAIRVFGEEKETLIAFLLTLAILYFSEIIPKTIGAKFWRNLAIPSAYIINFLVKVVYPLVWFSSLLTRMFDKNKTDVVSRDEIRAFAALGHKDGSLFYQENQLVENILTLREVKAGDILTPRSVVHALDENMTISAALAAEQTASFTRIPVYSGSIDNITGLIIKGTLYEQERQGNGDTLLVDIKQPLHRISESLPVLPLLDFFIKRHEHIFLVEDHFGQTAGIVTLEDAIETFLGREIIDESDQVEDMQMLAKAKFRQRLKSSNNKVSNNEDDE